MGRKQVISKPKEMLVLRLSSGTHCSVSCGLDRQLRQLHIEAQGACEGGMTMTTTMVLTSVHNLSFYSSFDSHFDLQMAQSKSLLTAELSQMLVISGCSEPFSGQSCTSQGLEILQPLWARVAIAEPLLVYVPFVLIPDQNFPLFKLSLLPLFLLLCPTEQNLAPSSLKPPLSFQVFLDCYLNPFISHLFSRLNKPCSQPLSSSLPEWPCAGLCLFLVSFLQQSRCMYLLVSHFVYPPF